MYRVQLSLMIFHCGWTWKEEILVFKLSLDLRAIFRANLDLRDKKALLILLFSKFFMSDYMECFFSSIFLGLASCSLVNLNEIVWIWILLNHKNVHWMGSKEMIAQYKKHSKCLLRFCLSYLKTHQTTIFQSCHSRLL